MTIDWFLCYLNIRLNDGFALFKVGLFGLKIEYKVDDLVKPIIAIRPILAI